VARFTLRLNGTERSLAIALLKAIRQPSNRDIDLAMNGNLCRCATYVRIRAAIHDAARELGG
jgi:isoquinoline 1-oxidoreductase alpha subunit